MVEPEKFPRLVIIGMFALLSLQTVFGALGFLCFKYDTAAIITYVITDIGYDL